MPIGMSDELIYNFASPSLEELSLCAYTELAARVERLARGLPVGGEGPVLPPLTGGGFEQRSNRSGAPRRSRPGGIGRRSRPG